LSFSVFTSDFLDASIRKVKRKPKKLQPCDEEIEFCNTLYVTFRLSSNAEENPNALAKLSSPKVI